MITSAEQGVLRNTLFRDPYFKSFKVNYDDPNHHKKSH